MKKKLIEIDREQGADLSEKLQEALPTIALDNHNALNTAFLNDVDGYMTYAQQVNGYAEAGDVFLGISTYGNSKNILYAAITAKAKGAKVIDGMHRRKTVGHGRCMYPGRRNRDL